MTTLEKIRAEIDEYLSPVFTKSDAKCQECANHLHDDVLQIIDKYASEECDNDCEHCAYIECPKGGE